MERTNQIAAFVKHHRKRLNLSQEELAQKAGVGLRFIRDLEQGKESLMMDKVNQVLELFGFRLLPEKGIDTYYLMFNHYNRHIRIYLRNKSMMEGFIVGENKIKGEIKSWKLVQNIHAIEYQKTKDEKLITELPHDSIERIENIP